MDIPCINDVVDLYLCAMEIGDSGFGSDNSEMDYSRDDTTSPLDLSKRFSNNVAPQHRRPDRPLSRIPRAPVPVPPWACGPPGVGGVGPTTLNFCDENNNTSCLTVHSMVSGEELFGLTDTSDSRPTAHGTKLSSSDKGKYSTIGKQMSVYTLKFNCAESIYKVKGRFGR